MNPYWMIIVITGVLVMIVTHGTTADGNTDRPMIFIPAGEFVMGTTQKRVEALADKYGVHPSLFTIEKPEKTVDIHAFLIDRYPVTNAEYAQFIEDTGHRAPSGWSNRQYPEGKADYPVGDVRWEDANAYAEWAGRRLPTAAEWEKAARGTDGRVYPWGNEWNENACRTDDPDCPQSLPRKTPVGAFPEGASPYGVLDMCGNVAEWTSTDSTEPNEERGWHWFVVKGVAGAHRRHYNFRCAARAFSAHENRRHDWLGFRCAMDVDTAPDDLQPPRPTPQLPPPPTADGPDEQAFGSSPIQIIARGGHSAATLRPPYFPQGQFRLFVPEQAGAEGLPLAWGIDHEPFQWQTNEGGNRANYHCVWTDTATLTVTLEGHRDCVDLTLSLKNLTDEPLRNPHSNVCFNPSASPYFADPERIRTMVWTDDGPVSLLKLPQSGPGEPMHGGWPVADPDQSAAVSDARARYPMIFITSRDGNWTIAQAYREGHTVASNAHYSCLHTRPVWPDVPPGEERTVAGKLYFIRGGPKKLLQRWRDDFADE